MALSDGVLGSFAPRESSHDSDGAWRLRPDVARRTVGVRVVSVVILEGSCDLSSACLRLALSRWGLLVVVHRQAGSAAFSLSLAAVIGRPLRARGLVIADAAVASLDAPSWHGPILGSIFLDSTNDVPVRSASIDIARWPWSLFSGVS